MSRKIYFYLEHLHLKIKIQLKKLIYLDCNIHTILSKIRKSLIQKIRNLDALYKEGESSENFSLFETSLLGGSPKGEPSSLGHS